MISSYNSSHTHKLDWPDNGFRRHGPISRRRALQRRMLSLMDVEPPKRQHVRRKSTVASPVLQLQQDVRATITRVLRQPVECLCKVAKFGTDSSDVSDSGKDYATSSSVTDEQVNTTLDLCSMAPSDSEHDRFLYSDLHNGELREFTKYLDREQIEAELHDIESYEEFKQTAERLGRLCNFENWRNNERAGSCEYNVSQLKIRMHEIEKVRCSRNPEKMLRLIRTQLSRYLGHMNKETLFHPFLHGTKRLIEEYTDSVCGLLEDFTRISRAYVTMRDRLHFAERLEETKLSFGKTTLLCSGGGTFGMRHIGTIKCLFETGNLPSVIAGSSAGSIVCAVLGSKTEDQLQSVLESFCHGDLKVFVGDDEEPGFMARAESYASNGYLFNSKNLKRVMKVHLGETTFAEAFRRTGRTVNITVSTSDAEGSRVLNYVNTPDVMLWSAVVASCALPSTYEASPVYIKCPKTGKIEPFEHGENYADGSLAGDIPFEAIHEQFNVNHSIVAQVNPHVVPFLEDKSAAERHRRPFLVKLLDILKEEVMHWTLPFEPMYGKQRAQWSSIIAQKYSGHITIHPKDFLDDMHNVLRNPTPQFMESAKHKGERATWERLSIIENHMKIEKALEAATKAAWDVVYNEA